MKDFYSDNHLYVEFYRPNADMMPAVYHGKFYRRSDGCIISGCYKHDGRIGLFLLLGAWV